MSDSAYIGKAAELHLVVSDPTSGEIIAYKHLESVDLTATSAIEVPVPNKHGDTYRYSLWVGATPQHYMVSDLVSAARPKFADCSLALRLNEQDRHMGLLPEPLYFTTGTVDCPVSSEGSSIRAVSYTHLTLPTN